MNEYDGIMAMTTTGNLTIWPDYTPQDTVSYPYYVHVTDPPRECSGDVHVFPCPHCDKCKCGNATVKRPKVKK